MAVFESGVGESAFSVENEVNQKLLDASQGETDRRNRMLCSAIDAEERAKYTEQSEDSDCYSTRLGLDGKDGDSLGQLDELEYCLADGRNRGHSEGRLRGVSIRPECLFILASAAFST